MMLGKNLFREMLFELNFRLGVDCILCILLKELVVYIKIIIVYCDMLNMFVICLYGEEIFFSCFLVN